MQPIPDLAALLKIAQSPVGQKLLAMLQSSDPSALNSIASAASSGNLEGAKEHLSRMLSSGEAQELLQQLENQL